MQTGEFATISPRPILVVDKEQRTREAVRELLELEGFQVSVAESGQAALEAFTRQSPQIVLTDVHMPGLGDIDVLKAALRVDPDMLVILMSTRAELPAAYAGLREGAFDHLQKPVVRDELLAVCHRALETRHLRFQNKLLRRRIFTAGGGRDVAAADPAVPAEASKVLRPERAAMERAALARVTRWVSEAIARAPGPVLERALSEPAAPEVLTDVMASALLDDSVEGEWAAALLRGANVQSELLEEAGGALSAAQVSELLGIGRAAVDKRRRQGSLLGLKLPSGDIVYPAAQFGPRDVLPDLAQVLASFRIRDPWMQLDLLLARHGALGGRTGFEALKAGDVDSVKQLAAGVGEQGL